MARREQELRHAIRTAFSRARQVRAAEAVRAAQLSLFKAERYWADAAEITGQNADTQIRNIERRVAFWTERPVDAILDDYAE